jgi:hypothetical protein
VGRIEGEWWGKSSERVISLCLQEGVSLFGGGDGAAMFFLWCM